MALREKGRRERRVIQDYLKMLRDAGVLLKFKDLNDRAAESREYEAPIQASRQGSCIDIAPDDKDAALYPYYNTCCKKPEGLALRVASWDIPAVITLGENVFHFYRTSGDYGKRDSHKFSADYVKKLNDRC